MLLRYYLKSRNDVKEFNALFDLMVADKLKSSLNPSTREYCRLQEGEGTFTSQKIAETADFFMNGNDKSFGAEQHPKNNKFQKWKNKNTNDSEERSSATANDRYNAD